jgi:hypothetical protein
MDRCLTELHSEATQRKFTADEWGKARIPARRTFEEFLDAVRIEFALPPVPHHFYDDTDLTAARQGSAGEAT